MHTRASSVAAAAVVVVVALTRAATASSCPFTTAFNNDTQACVEPYAFCGVYGTPDIADTWDADAASNPVNASTFVCVCSHARTGPACDACNATEFCGAASATCADSPHATAWCVCGDTPGVPDWRPWWAASNPQAPCTACPQGYVRFGDACVDIDAACVGDGRDDVLTQVTGACTCRPGWHRNDTAVPPTCASCLDGYILDTDDGECKDCTTLCGGTAFATCGPRPAPNASACTCNTGVAGPPCVAGGCVPGRVWNADTAACVPCPAGCGDVGHGECVLGAAGVAQCVCGTGWTGANCSTCAMGFVAVSASVCAACPMPCAGECVAVNGTAVCACDDNWDGNDACTACAPGTVPSADFALCVACDPPCEDDAVCTLVDDAAAACVCPDHSVSDGAGGCTPCAVGDTTGPLHGCLPCDDCAAGTQCVGVFDGDAWAATCACADGLHADASGQCVAAVAWPGAADLVDVDDSDTPVLGRSAPTVYGGATEATQRKSTLQAILYAVGVAAVLWAAGALVWAFAGT